jgi:hypothetical protein
MGVVYPKKDQQTLILLHSEMIKETNLQRNCQSLLTLQSARLPTAPHPDTFHLQPVRLLSIRKSRAAGPGQNGRKQHAMTATASTLKAELVFILASLGQ